MVSVSYRDVTDVEEGILKHALSGTDVPSQDMRFFLTLYAVHSILPPAHTPCPEARALRIHSA